MSAHESSGLLHRLTAVDHHCMPHHEGRSVGAQPQYGRGNLLGLSHSPCWLLGDHLCSSLGSTTRETRHHRSVDVPGTDCIDPEILRSVIESSGPSESDYSL